jgi:molecular chaperone DnaK
MVKNAEREKEKDKKRRELIDLKNEADNSIYNTEKSLNEHRSKLNQQDAEEIDREVSNLRGILQGNLEIGDIQRLRDAVNKVKNAAMKIGQAMYQQGQ